MKATDKQVLRIDINFALCESSYWISYCCLSGFVAIYLTYRGLTNTQIGMLTSLSCILAILLQLVVSYLLDKYRSYPIKRLISVLFLIGMAGIACVHFLPLPVGLMSTAYIVAYAAGQSNNGYLNAQLVQFNNAGIPAHYGWPRGTGSVCYALAAFVYGILAEKYTPAILMPIYLAGTAVTILCVMMMPDPNRIARIQPEQTRDSRMTSYRQMLTGNPTLMVLMLCIFINSIGNSACYTFIIRVIEGLGGGTAEYGISEMIRAGAEMPMLVISGLLLKRFRKKSMLAVSFLFTGIRALSMAIAPSIGFVYACSTLNMFSVGLSVFCQVLFINGIVGPSEKVRGQSLSVLCGSLGSILGNLIGGAMIDLIGLQAMMLTSMAFSFCAFALLIAFCRPEKYGLQA